MAPVPARPERRGPAGSGIFGATIRIAAERRGAAILRNILKKVVNISSPGGRGERVIAATLRDSIGQVEDGLRRRFPGLLPEVLIPPSPLGNQGGTRIRSASAKKVGPRHDRTPSKDNIITQKEMHTQIPASCILIPFSLSFTCHGQPCFRYRHPGTAPL